MGQWYRRYRDLWYENIMARYQFVKKVTWTNAQLKLCVCVLTCRNAEIGGKLSIFSPVWPWNWTDDPEKTTGHHFYALQNFVHHLIAIWIETSVMARKRSDLGRIGFDLCDLELVHLMLTFCMDITFVGDNYFWKFHDDTMRATLPKKVWPTDGRPNGQG